VEELDRLHLVLQAPSGGLVEEPPIAIGEHIVRCLAMEEAGGAGGGKRSECWDSMQNGRIAVGDAERVLRRYLEEELNMAEQEMEGGDHDNQHGTADGVACKLSKLSLGSALPMSPPRSSRGVSHAIAEHATDAEHASYIKELSYRPEAQIDDGPPGTREGQPPRSRGGERQYLRRGVPGPALPVLQARCCAGDRIRPAARPARGRLQRYALLPPPALRARHHRGVHGLHHCPRRGRRPPARCGLRAHRHYVGGASGRCFQLVRRGALLVHAESAVARGGQSGVSVCSVQYV